MSEQFQLFKYLDSALVKRESRAPKASSVPAVWPSEASADKIDKTEGLIVGKCAREVYLRMIGSDVSNNVDAIGAWKWTVGRLVEAEVVELARKAGIFVAGGVRCYVPEFYLSLELDMVTIDPKSKQGCIGECKTYYGYNASKEIVKLGVPKMSNLIQLCIYLLEIGTGAKMKEVIRKSLEERQALDEAQANHRNRIEVDLEKLEQMDDGPMRAKLVYLDRGSVDRTEFDISIEEDFDGSHYPVVNGQTYKIFTIESIYERFKYIQAHWFKARRDAVEELAKRGINPPESLKLVLMPGDNSDRNNLVDKKSTSTLEEEQKYIEQLDALVRKLPVDYWPPAEFEWAYSQAKVDKLFSMGSLKVPKTKYEKLKKGKITHIGDFECLYCKYKNLCVPLQNPNWAYQLYDISQMEEEE